MIFVLYSHKTPIVFYDFALDKEGVQDGSSIAGPGLYTDAVTLMMNRK